MARRVAVGCPSDLARSFSLGWIFGQLTGTSALWSGATAAQGLAHSFPEPLVSRVATSIGQGFTNPSSYTILGRLHSAERRAVNGLYASSVYFGGGLAALSRPR